MTAEHPAKPSRAVTPRVLRFLALLLTAACRDEGRVELTVATVSNPDMRIMQRLSGAFEADYPGIRLRWVVLPENDLRTRVTSDLAVGAGSFDVVTVGAYEIALWSANGWIRNLDSLMAAWPEAVQPGYERDDILGSVRQALSTGGALHGLPFYGESSMTFYNRALFRQAGLEMPPRPTWDEIARLACRLHAPRQGRYGIVLRGLPGWGEAMAPLTTIANTFGARWFDMDWEPQLDSPEWKAATRFYVDLLRRCGQPGPTGTGFTEALTLMAQGRAAIWIDATVAAGFLSDSAESRIAQDVGFAPAPVGPVPKGSHWLWIWSLAIPRTSRHQREALAFITWATSPDYVRLVGDSLGWSRVPPGTRASTYAREEYRAAAAYAPLVLQAITSADPDDATRDPVPYTGIQYVGIPEFQGAGTDVSQLVAEALAGTLTVEQALTRAQERTRATMRDAGYYRRARRP